jgi:hypothetical protein
VEPSGINAERIESIVGCQVMRGLLCRALASECHAINYELKVIYQTSLRYIESSSPTNDSTIPNFCVLRPASTVGNLVDRNRRVFLLCGVMKMHEELCGGHRKV